MSSRGKRMLELVLAKKKETAMDVTSFGDGGDSNPLNLSASENNNLTAQASPRDSIILPWVSNEPEVVDDGSVFVILESDVVGQDLTEDFEIVNDLAKLPNTSQVLDILSGNNSEQAKGSLHGITSELSPDYTNMEVVGLIEQHESDNESDNTYTPDADSDHSMSSASDEEDITVPVHDQDMNGTADNNNNIVHHSDCTKGAVSLARVQRKRKRNSGESYTTKNGKFINAKLFKPLADCRNKCREKLSELDLKNLFEEFWKLESFNRRVVYAASLVETAETATTRIRKNNEHVRLRDVSHTYFVQVKGEKIKFCKKCFLNTFDVTERFMKTVHAKKAKGISGLAVSPDKRGRAPPSIKLSADKKNLVISHINSFPAYESHYSRRHTNKKYLGYDLNISKMYVLYKETHDNPVSKSVYSKIFHSLGLAFKRPHVDTCNFCDTHNNTIGSLPEGEEKEMQKSALVHHQTLADAAYAQKKADKEKARENPNMRVFSFDLQQCLPTPYLTTSVIFYKRQLWVYNLTVHDCVSGQAYCYTWNETEASRGGNEIASCLYEHFKNLSVEVTHIILYSDTCGGQNKNSHVSAMLLTALKHFPHIKTIDHKFLVPGHTHMECDVDHLIIERAKKHTSLKIEHPCDWNQLIRISCRKIPMIVKEMTQSIVYDFSSLLKDVFQVRTKDESGNKFMWRPVQWLSYTQDLSPIVLFKHSLEDDDIFLQLSFHRRKAVGGNHLRRKHAALIPISKEKKKDLLSILQLINPRHHDFYRQLPDDNIANIHPIVESDSD